MSRHSFSKTWLQRPGARRLGLLWLGLLWLGVLSGPLVWLVDLEATDARVASPCGMGDGGPLLAVNVLCLLLGAAAAALSWRSLRETPGAGPSPHPDGLLSHERFLSCCGLALSLLFLVVTAATTLPLFLVESCAP